MSIAVSAFVRPSRTARRLLLAWSLAQFAAAAAVAPLPLRMQAGPWLAAVLAGAGLVLAWRAARSPKTHRIDISGTGELRVTVQQDVCSPNAVRRAGRTGAGGGGSAADGAGPLVLLPGSVLWPGLMLLNLTEIDRSARPKLAVRSQVRSLVWPLMWPRTLPLVLPIWRDSVDGDAWRALAVALGVIGKPGRNEGGKNR
jgi:hypothetical protein